LVRAGVLYGALLVVCLWAAGASMHDWAMPFTEYTPELVLGLLGTLLVGRGARSWLSFPKLSLRGALLAGGAIVLALCAGEALGVMLELSDDLMLLEFRSLDAGLLLALFFIAGLTPLLEEWLFRGAILELLIVVFSRHTAIVVTALLFASVHLSPLTIVHHGLLGYVCGRVRVGTGSLWSAVACHAVYNTAVVLWTW